MSDRYNEEKRREYNRQYKQNNKERIDKLIKDWHIANPDKNKTYKKAYREKNKDILNAKERERYWRNVERERERGKLYSQNNPEKALERSKRWNRNNPEKAMFNRAKTRAKRSGIEFTITLKDIVIPPYCPVFGIPLYTSIGGMCDNSPSLDRVNPYKGYIPGNVCVISHRANHIKNNGTADEHMRIASFMRSYGYDLG
jgi:hypothetical protein